VESEKHAETGWYRGLTVDEMYAVVEMLRDRRWQIMEQLGSVDAELAHAMNELKAMYEETP
jgi:hypothetical protein